MIKDIGISFENIGNVTYMAIWDEKSNSHYLMCAYPDSEKLYCFEEIKIMLERILKNRNVIEKENV